MQLKILGAVAALALAGAFAPQAALAQEERMQRVPDRRPGEGAGPFRKLVIRGAMLIDGSGGPAKGPVDIVVEGNRIAAIMGAGTPGLPLSPNRAPRDFDHEIDATGMYVMPGFVDTHGHNGDPDKAPNATYGYKLWLAHGVTAVRGVGLYGGPNNQALTDKQRSAANTIVAPRLFNYAVLGDVWNGGSINSPEQARAWVRWAKSAGHDGMKIFNSEPRAVTAAALDEARKVGLGTVAHLGQGGVAEVNARTAGEFGLGTVTHFYGHFESLLKDGSIPRYPADYNMFDEQDRFYEISKLADQIVEPGGPEWKAYLDAQLARGVIFNPTLNIYSAGRDVMRARNADWHVKYTLPSLNAFFQPSRVNHGSYWYDWTTEKEISWRRFYVPYMRLMNDYKNIGGIVTVGSDPGYIYQTWGFSYIQEMEMLQEAGFTPLEVIRAATSHGAYEIYRPKGIAAPFGTVRAGMLADLVIVPGNPLHNLKLLYGTGFEKLDANGKVERVGGVKYTIKDGIVYDAHALLADVAAMVEAQKAAGR
ncbi:amidohydrolase family protein [Sphingomonas lutea]|uniref:Amidohydrolase family protein n=1 Tax=Sphingomonas lutea TaxID=1045317 RepID=A0A7G9SK15_9SPHN|nr:amidohydrolase family protein [Sphingomonas lutea]QNN68190.1 amidohydrolase family protein [Sphingomonas lutea]